MRCSSVFAASHVLVCDAAALAWAAGEEGTELVAADARLCEAARLEGLAIVRL